MLIRFRLANSIGRLAYVRGLTDVPSRLRQKLMNDFTMFLNGQAGEETVFHMFKLCATSLRLELPSTRVSLADHAYTTMKEKGLPLSTKLYNSLLNVYLSNRHPFSPAEFLSSMREDGVIPNRGTLSMLLEAYCQQGNMTGAKQILKELKDRDIPINEDGYASLIMGHSESGNMDSALKIIDIMKEGTLQPGLISYSALLSGYAFNGDVESINELIASLKKERIFVSYNVFGDMIDAMSRGGHNEKIPQVLDIIRNKEWMYNDLIRKAEELSARGENNSSYLLLDALSKLNLMGEGRQVLITGYVHALKHMVLNNEPEDVLLSWLSSACSSESMSQELFYVELLRALYLGEKWEEAKTILLNMQKKGLTVKPSMLYPPIVACMKRNDIKGHFQWLSVLEDLQMFPDIMITDYTTRALQKQGKDMIQFLKDENIPLTKGIVHLTTQMHCINHKYPALLAKLKTFNPSVIPATNVLEVVAVSVKTTPSPNLETLHSLYSFLAPLCEEKQLRRVLHATVFNLTVVSPGKNAFVFVKNLLEQKIINTVAGNTCNFILISLNEKDYIDDFFEFLRLMKAHGVEIDNYHRRQILKIAAKTGTPFAAMSAFSKMKADGVVDSSTYSNLIIALCRSKKRDLALEYYQKIADKAEYKLSFIAYNYLLQALVQKGDLQSAIDLRKSKILDVGLKPGLFMFNIFLEGYCNIGDIKSLQAEFDAMVASGVHPSSYSYHKLMQGYARQNDIDNVRRILKEVLSDNVEVNREIVSTLVFACLACEDIKGALEHLEHYCAVKPYLNTFVSFVKASVDQNETEMTEKVIGIMRSNGLSEDVINHVMMFAMSSCGNQEEAFDFAKKNGLSINFDLINNFGRVCHLNGDVKGVHSLMNLLRMFGIKPYMLHIPLIKAYATSGDLESLLTVGKDLEAHGEPPKQFFHTTVSGLLKEHSEEAPFVLAGSELRETN